MKTPSYFSIIFSEILAKSPTALNIYKLSWKNIKSLGFQSIVDSILELQSFTKVKPKKRPPASINKKQSIFQIDLEKSICQNLSKFKYKAKAKKTGKESQSNIYVKKSKI